MVPSGDQLPSRRKPLRPEDRKSVRAIARAVLYHELRRSGLSNEDAMWGMLTDPVVGDLEYQGPDAKPRPNRRELIYRRSRMLSAAGRSSGPIVSEIAKANVAVDVDEACAFLSDLVRGDVEAVTKEEVGMVRERREAATWMLESFGMGPQRGGTQVNTQVNVGAIDERDRQLAAEVLAGKVYRATRIEDVATEPAPPGGAN